jgi:hypothetical protein
MAGGRVTFDALVPGATYRIAKRESKVDAGKTLDLGDTVINPER